MPPPSCLSRPPYLRHGVALIIGTAGHIDHGKTSLVKALTGVDADRLKEEKARGITIDLGFAYKPLPDGEVLGFVDVPGHEKLVRNMLAGATGIDHVMLVVAADDGADAADARAPGDPRPARPGARRGGADQERPGDARAAGRSRAPKCAPCWPTRHWLAHRSCRCRRVTGEGIDALLEHLDAGTRARWRRSASRGSSALRWTAASRWRASAPSSPARPSPAGWQWASG